MSDPRGPDPGPPTGIAVIDKAAGWTSHDVVAKSRGLLGTRKVGHAGTLDPSATGVLVLGVGRATRLLRYLGDLPKTYVGEMALGVETNTLDADGEVTATHRMEGIGLDDVREAARSFLGPILQVPPMVSAIQVGGRRLHELAREGIEIERQPRPVTVHTLAVAATDDPLVFRLDVECSSGTYIRSLAADLGSALGGGAHLRNLRRTAVGGFTLEGAVPVEDLDPASLRPPEAAVAHLREVEVDAELAAEVGHGKVLPIDRLAVGGEGPWAVTGPGGTLLAVYAAHGLGMVKPEMVFAAG